MDLRPIIPPLVDRMDVPRMFWIDRPEDLVSVSPVFGQQASSSMIQKILVSDLVPIIHLSESKLLSKPVHESPLILMNAPKANGCILSKEPRMPLMFRKGIHKSRED